MKKLVKSEVCGPMNSARVHGSLLKSQNMRLEKKERKETQTWIRVGYIERKDKTSVCTAIFLM